MISTLDLVRPNVSALPAYEAAPAPEQIAEEIGKPLGQLLKLDANENPYGALPEVRKALGKMDRVSVYPDPESRRIREELAKYHRIAASSIVMGAGSDELIDLIMRICIDPGDTVLNCPPTFSMYAFDGALNRARMVNVPRNPDFSLDMEGILAAVQKEQPKLLFLANPNNPDGSLLPEAEFRQLVELPLLLVMDEAYTQFCNEECSVIKEVGKRQNLIVLRTFSKWAGLAGLRIGYGVVPEGFEQVVLKVKQPYNLSAAAELAAVVTMQNVAKTDASIALIRRQRDDFYQKLAQIDWLKPYPSQTNFILCRIQGKDGRKVQAQLRQKGILVRYFDEPGLRNSLRISMGTAEQMETVLQALKEIR